jgi:uncharacterized protein (TIGR00369 family)
MLTAEQRELLIRSFATHVPHNGALGLRMISVDEGEALSELPYDPKLVGNVLTGTLHGGAITTLLDATSGTAVFSALTKLVTIATLDLRIDYLRPAESGRAVLCRATCYRTTRNVAFTRAVAYHADGGEAEPVAHSVGTFMLGTRTGPRP